MKRINTALLLIILSITLTSCKTFQPTSNNDLDIIGIVKKIVDGDMVNQKSWKTYYLFNTCITDHNIKHIFTGDSTLEERRKDQALRNEYFFILKTTLNLRYLVNGVLKHSVKKEVKNQRIEAFINSLDQSVVEPSDFSYTRDVFAGSSTKGIMLAFFQGDKPIYIIILSPDTEEIKQIMELKYITIIKFNYTDTGLVKNIDSHLIKRNKEINQEIEKIWKNLNIGVWTDKYPYKYNSDFAFLPIGEKKNMYSIEQFCLLKLKTELDEDKIINKEWYAEPIAKLEMKKNLSEDEKSKLKKLKDRYFKVRLPYEKEREKNLNYFEKKLRKHRTNAGI